MLSTYRCTCTFSNDRPKLSEVVHSLGVLGFEGLLRKAETAILDAVGLDHSVRIRSAARGYRPYDIGFGELFYKAGHSPYIRELSNEYMAYRGLPTADPNPSAVTVELGVIGHFPGDTPPEIFQDFVGKANAAMRSSTELAQADLQTSRRYLVIPRGHLKKLQQVKNLSLPKRNGQTLIWT